MKNIPFEPERFYHVFNRGNNKQLLFYDPSNYLFFKQRMKRYLPPVCKILSYCLLPNHFHFVLEFLPETRLPAAYQNGRKKLHQPLANLFNSYAKSINKKFNRTGSLFQEHLHRNLINTEDYLRDVIMYTHLNPENHGIADDFSMYLYSSYRELTMQQTHALCDSSSLDWFGGPENFIHCHNERNYRNLQKLGKIGKQDQL